jgi:SulP family sulfate permease
MPSGASASRTAAMEAAGTRSQVPSLVAAITVVLVVVWFTDAVAMLPSAALAGLVANAVVGTIEAGELRHLWRVRRSEFAIALGCLLGVLVLGPMAAIVLAVLASAIDMMRRAAAMPWMRLGQPDEPSAGRFAADPDAEAPPGMLVLRPGGPLFFATADGLREVLEQAAREPGVEWVVVDLEQVTDLDPTAAEAFADGIDTIVGCGRVVAVTRAMAPLRAVLDRHRLTERIGVDHCFATTREAAMAFAARTGRLAGEV